tara:strand:- start:575 stop:829 length:255 start_codon:yes stop_codon:yes gene_type:complete
MPKLHRTVGIYPDGSYKVNTVTASHLPIHVDYNKTWRWGRALLVDDELVYAGLGVSDDRIAEVRSRLGPAVRVQPGDVDSAPYC